MPPELKALGAEPSEVELVASPEGDEESGKVQRGGLFAKGAGLYTGMAGASDLCKWHFQSSLSDCQQTCVLWDHVKP